MNTGNGVYDDGFTIYYFGKIIEVAESAVPALLAQGDSDAFISLSPEEIKEWEEYIGDKLPNADCWFY